MDKIFKDQSFSRIDNQLELLDKKKKSILRDLYCSYEIYLSSLRAELFNSVSKGLFSLAEIINCRGIIYKDNIDLLLKNEIKLFIDQSLPFLTIEQLSILGESYFEKNEKIITKFKNNEFISGKDSNEEYLDDEINFGNNYYYYYLNNKKYNLNYSVDLDNNYYYENSLDVDTSLLDRNEENQFSEQNCDLLENKNNSNKKYKSFNIFEENQFSSILEWTDLIDIGLNFKLKTMSIEVNNIFFSTIFTKEMIPENLIYYLFENSFLTTNPKPFVAKIDLLSNEYIYSDEILKSINFSKIFLFYINSTEIDFNNININMKRNNISKFKNSLKELIKKEQYWNNKKLNYDNCKIYSN